MSTETAQQPAEHRSPAEHYREAERLAHGAAKYLAGVRPETASAATIIALAQVHATLALAPPSP